MTETPQMIVGFSTPNGQSIANDSADAVKMIQHGASGGQVALVGFTVSSSQAVTSSGSTNGATLTNPGARGVLLYLDVSSRAASGGLSPTLDILVQGQDPVTSNWFNLPGAAFTQVTTSTSAQVLIIHPTVPNDSGTGFRRRPGPLTPNYRLQWTTQNIDSGGGQPGSYEFTVGGVYIP